MLSYFSCINNKLNICSCVEKGNETSTCKPAGALRYLEIHLLV